MKSGKSFKKEGVSYWLSYSDMMAALILVLVLILSISIFESKAEIEAKEKMIIQQEQQLNEIIGVKKEIIKDLQDEFKGTKLKIKIDSNTGAIVFDSNLLFDPDKWELKDNSKVFLDEFLPKYFSVLLKKKYAENISEIMIEGHTAHYSTYMYCLDLSQKRAYAVAEYILQSGTSIVSSKNMNVLRQVLTANGRAWNDPVYNKDGKTYNDSACRRVEIKFRLKDDEMIQEILNMLD